MRHCEADTRSQDARPLRKTRAPRVTSEILQSATCRGPQRVCGGVWKLLARPTLHPRHDFLLKMCMLINHAHRVSQCEPKGFEEAPACFQPAKAAVCVCNLLPKQVLSDFGHLSFLRSVIQATGAVDSALSAVRCGNRPWRRHHRRNAMHKLVPTGAQAINRLSQPKTCVM